ncbi:hypothetical protein M3J09_005447 [Ascochyta lentis]
MKYFTLVILGLAGPSYAACCNGAIQLPSSSYCPKGHTNTQCCRSTDNKYKDFVVTQYCVFPIQKAKYAPSLISCGPGAYISCCEGDVGGLLRRTCE